MSNRIFVIGHVNPDTDTIASALGYAVCEEMCYDDKGNAIERDFDRYHIFRADEMPQLERFLSRRLSRVIHSESKPLQRSPWMVSRRRLVIESNQS